MNRKLGQELHHAVKQMEADDAIGCIVITGSGDRAFSAGGDIEEQLADDAQYSDAGARCDARQKRQLRDQRVFEADDRHDERPGLWRWVGARLIARYADRLRGIQVPLSGCSLRPDQQHVDAAQSGRLADREGAAVLCSRRGGAGSVPDRAAEPSGSARATSRKDDGARQDDRREPPRGSDGRQGSDAAADGTRTGGTVRCGARVHDDTCSAVRRPRMHSPTSSSAKAWPPTSLLQAGR